MNYSSFSRILFEDIKSLLKKEYEDNTINENIIINYIPVVQKLFLKKYGGFNLIKMFNNVSLITENEKRKLMRMKMFGKDLVLKEMIISSMNYYSEMAISFILSQIYPATPNFSHFIGTFFNGKNPVFVSEYEGTKTFSSWLLSKEYNIQDLYSYLLQIIFTLHIAQKKFHFGHYDLHTENIFITDTKLEHIYDINGIYYKLFSNKTMKIIDFDQSRLIYKGQLYGIIKINEKNSFIFNQSFDIFKLIHFILYDLLVKKNNYNEYNEASFLLIPIYKKIKDIYGIAESRTIEELTASFIKGRNQYFDHFETANLTLMDFIQEIGKNMQKSFIQVSESKYLEQKIENIYHTYEYEKCTKEDLDIPLFDSYVMRRGNFNILNRYLSMNHKKQKTDKFEAGKNYDLEIYNNYSKVDIDYSDVIQKIQNINTAGDIYSCYKNYILPSRKIFHQLQFLNSFCVLSTLTDTIFHFIQSHILRLIGEINLNFEEKRLYLQKKLEDNESQNGSQDLQILDIISILHLTSRNNFGKIYLDNYVIKTPKGSYVPPASNLQVSHLEDDTYKQLLNELGISKKIRYEKDDEFYEKIKTEIKFDFEILKNRKDISTSYIHDLKDIFKEKVKIYYIFTSSKNEQIMLIRDIIMNIILTCLNIPRNHSYIYKSRIENLQFLNQNYESDEVQIFGQGNLLSQIKIYVGNT